MSPSDPMSDEEIVGFENDIEVIIGYLLHGTKDLDVVPVVGMGGQGKTTCARKVYSNDYVVSHFDVRAWCTISQTYNRGELLQDILSQVTGYNYKVDNIDELADMLRKRLMGRRYLIVLDDMWAAKAWEDLMLSFPDGENRSRVIVTTRLEEVVQQVTHHTLPHSLPFLTLEKSCKLLHKKVFERESCPSQLTDVSLHVAEKCKGLPLMVILVAGIIKRRKTDASWWHEVKDSLLSYLGTSEEYVHSMVNQSYNNLRPHLRPCLLYMGMFPEDHIIPGSQLISLWIAEGFVQDVESERFEETASGYLMDLISSNMVMVSKRKYNGKVRYCQIHDVVLSFCLNKSRAEKFMLMVKGDSAQFQPFAWNETRLSFYLIAKFSSGVTDELSTFPTDELSKTRKPSYQHLRTLFIIDRGITRWDPLCQIPNFSLLNVLDLSFFYVFDFSTDTLDTLVHLKYLAVYSEGFYLRSKSPFLHLETLIVVNEDKAILAAIFWEMKRLRYVDISNAIFDSESNKDEVLESSRLESLRILKRVKLFEGIVDNTSLLLQRCPNLQELGIIINRHGNRIIHLNLETLTQLQLLDIFFYDTNIISKLQLPSNLKKLKLEGSFIVNTTSLVEGLSSLEYLKLRDYSFESKEWCLGDISFDNLKFLKLHRLGIIRWEASETSFPQLETLVIRECNELEEIPFSFVDVPTLKQIKVIWCNKESLEASAMKIKEEVKESEGSDRVDIFIKRQQ